MQKIVFLVFALITLSIGQTPITCAAPVTPKCNAALAEPCGQSAICGAGLYCDLLLGAAAVCKTQGTIGQACTSVLDCYNLVFRYDYLFGGSFGCVDLKCVETSFLGYNETCQFAHECQSSNCSNGACGLGFQDKCSTDAFCPYGQFCNTTSGACLPALAVGSACGPTGAACGPANTCLGGVCTAPFTVADGGVCSTDNQCSGTCSGCARSSFNSTSGMCSKSLSLDNIFTSDNCTFNSNCTSGACACDAKGSNTTKCLQNPPPVYTVGECQTQFTDLQTCLETNKCPPHPTLSFNAASTAFIPFYGFPAYLNNRSCNYKCKPQLDCMHKCRVSQLEKQTPGQYKKTFCADPPTFPCATTVGTCAYGAASSTTTVTTTTTTTQTTTSSQAQASSSTGGSTSASTASASAGGSTTASTSRSATVSATVSASSTNVSATVSASSTNVSASRSATTTTTTTQTTTTTAGTTTGFGMVLIAPLFALIAALF